MREVKAAGATIIALTDAAPAPVDWAYAFPHDPVEAADPVLARWAPDRRFHTRFTVFALVRAGRAVLVDAGIGPGPSAYFHGLTGSLDRRLAEAGIAVEAVEGVFFTHFHLDHVGWASRDGEAMFPNARYHAPRAELDHWREKGSEAALAHHVADVERHVMPLVEAGRLTGLRPGEATPFWPDLAYRAAPGHTPGHCAVVLGQGADSIVIAGDAWHSPAQVERPDWCHRADRDREAASASRRNLAAFAAQTGAIVTAGHFPQEVAFGRIRPGGSDGLRFVPLP